VLSSCGFSADNQLVDGNWPVFFLSMELRLHSHFTESPVSLIDLGTGRMGEADSTSRDSKESLVEGLYQGWLRSSWVCNPGGFGQYGGMSVMPLGVGTIWITALGRAAGFLVPSRHLQ